MIVRGFDIRPISATEADSVLRWCQGGDVPVPDSAHPAGDLLLATLDDGVVWGRRIDDVWQLSSVVDRVSPTLRSERLQELRIFGPGCAEWLIWRCAEGLAGRILTDLPDLPAHLAPRDEQRVLLADRRVMTIDGSPVAPPIGFTVVGDGAGSVQVVPLPLGSEAFADEWWPLRLAVRHYYEEDTRGVVRIAASTLQGLIVELRGQR